MANKRKSGNHSPNLQASSKKIRYDQACRKHVGERKFASVHDTGPSTSLPPLPPISPAMAKSVFTHQSKVSYKDDMNQSASYERLEFIGDIYVELMATRFVMDQFKDLPVGRLSQIRESLVRNETLGEIAVKYGLDKRLTAPAEVKNNPRQWTKVKGDLVEAYVAAIVSADDEIGRTGFATAENWLRQLWTLKLGNTLLEKTPNLNAKDVLSRRITSRGVKLEYLEERPMKQLNGGQQTYFIGVYITGWGHEKKHLGSGQGLSKTGAGNLAAEEALQNPLTEEFAAEKRKYDERIRSRQEPEEEVNGNAVSGNHGKHERLTRERQAVEKKRNMFMSTEFG